MLNAYCLPNIMQGKTEEEETEDSVLIKSYEIFFLIGQDWLKHEGQKTLRVGLVSYLSVISCT